MTKPFDPDAAAKPGSGIFGLPHSFDDARVVLLPIPFDATTSYGGGASAGPEAILRASAQVDLFDHHFGDVHEHGIHMLAAPRGIAGISKRCRRLAEPIIAKGGAEASDRWAVGEIERAGERVNDMTHEGFAQILAEGKVPGLVGGDHSTPYGAIKACGEHVAALARRGDKKAKKGLGILHIDAHMDLRDAFEGFRFSHASIMFNVLRDMPGVTKLVQVGIRDYSAGERELAESQPERVRVYYDADLFERRERSKAHGWLNECRRIVAELPPYVYISFDIDGLDPSMCPHTGTPVPGGLSFNHVCTLLKALKDSGRRVIGFDLVEVCPDADPEAPEWDANVGSRILYKLCGCAA